MGILSKQCHYCGSTEHAGEHCPHGIFSRKCEYCESTEHATKDCPHGIFSRKCNFCGSTEHATDDCPHGIFSRKCNFCGSTEHVTEDCPHGIFSRKCNWCGSKDHPTDSCPQMGSSHRVSRGEDVEAAEHFSTADHDAQAPVPSHSGHDLGPALTSEDLQRLEISARKSYVKVLLGVCAVTLWVLFFGGYKFVAILIVLPLLFKAFGDMPSFEPIASISINASNGSGVAWLLRFVGGWAPFVFLTYILINH